MKIIPVLVMPLFLFAKVHYAKVEPYETVTLKSSVSGLVIDADLDLEGKVVKSKRIIHIDDALDISSLKESKQSLVLLKEMLDLNEEIATTLKHSMHRQESYFKRISKLATASKTQKDNAFSAFSSAKSQYLSTREKIISLKKQMIDIQSKIDKLEDTVAKKSIVLKDRYLYKLLVRKGDFVAPGTPMARVDNISRAKLVLFLGEEELENIALKSIYIDEKKSTYKIDKIWKVADEKFISLYRAEVIIPAPRDIFSKLIKVEIK